jgi:hypothetical protein
VLGAGIVSDRSLLQSQKFQRFSWTKKVDSIGVRMAGAYMAFVQADGEAGLFDTFFRHLD